MNAQRKEEEKLQSFSDEFDKAKESGDADELKKVSQEFEAFFIREIFKSMRNSSQWGEGLIEKSHARSTYESMHDEKLADDISQGRGIGISDMLFKQMLKSYGIESETAQNITDNETDNTETDDDEDTALDVKG